MIPFGKTLRDAREAKGISISQIAETTHMLSSIVQDLENEDFTRIVAPIYGRGFVKLYCEVVGLDPKPLIAEFMEIYNGNRVPSIRERAPAAPAEHAPVPKSIPEPPPIANPIPAPKPVDVPVAPPTPAPTVIPTPEPSPVVVPPPVVPAVPDPEPVAPAAFEQEPLARFHPSAPTETVTAPEPPMPDIGPLFNPEPPPPVARPSAPQPIPAEPTPARPEDSAEADPQPVRRTLSRYASPLNEPQSAPIKLPHISIPPQVWRIAVLVIVVLSILVGLGLGIRALYRVTTDQTPNPPAEVVSSSQDKLSDKPTPSKSVPAAKPTSKASAPAAAEKAPASTADTMVASPVSRQPQKIPSLYID